MIRWEWTHWAGLDRDTLHAVAQLRQAVFVVEQDCPYLDLDGRDPDAWHLQGFDEAGLVAHLRAFDGSEAAHVIGRVVVDPRARRRGLGHALMHEGAQRVRHTFGAGPIRVSAQAHLQRFYERLGYAVDGEGYLEDGIPHLPMINRS